MGRKTQITTVGRLEDKINQLLWEKNMIEEGSILAVDSDGNDCSQDRILDIEYDIEDIEGILSELRGS